MINSFYKFVFNLRFRRSHCFECCKLQKLQLKDFLSLLYMRKRHPLSFRKLAIVKSERSIDVDKNVKKTLCVYWEGLTTIILTQTVFEQVYIIIFQLFEIKLYLQWKILFSCPRTSATHMQRLRRSAYHRDDIVERTLSVEETQENESRSWTTSWSESFDEEKRSWGRCRVTWDVVYMVSKDRTMFLCKFWIVLLNF